jgi:O-antigen ligase
MTWMEPAKSARLSRHFQSSNVVLIIWGWLKVSRMSALRVRSASVVGGVLALGMATSVLIVKAPGLVLAVLALGVLVLLPPWVLLAGAVVGEYVYLEPISGGGLIVSDILLGTFLLRWSVPRLVHQLPLLPSDLRPVAGWVLAFLAWAWISLVITDAWGSAPALARVSLYMLVLLAASSYPSRWVPLAVGIYALVEAVAALLGVTGTVAGRLVGFGGDPEILGTLMIAGIACSVTFRRFHLMVLALLALVGALTLTRATWVAASVMLALILVPRLAQRKSATLVLGMVVVVAAVLAHPYLTAAFDLNPDSVPLRLASWQAGLDLVAAHPIVGVGWAQNPVFNLWIELASSTGVLGAALFSILLIALFRRLVSKRGSVARAGLLYFVGFVIYSGQVMTLGAGNRLTITFTVLVGSALGALEAPVVRARTGTLLRPSQTSGVRSG